MKLNLLFAGVLLMVSLNPQEARVDNRAISLGFGDIKAWQLQADQPWWALVDIRDMLNLFHPFVASQTGNKAGASREVTFPSDWKPPFALRFYCADDYFADPNRHKPGQLGTESFFEHRFKQVLIDDTVIWSRDVIDENILGSQTVFQLDITPHVRPGKPFKLTFRVFDKTSVLERSERDVWFIGGVWYASGDGKTEESPRFHTAIWFADPVAGEQSAVEAMSPGRRPHEATVRERHQSRWPLPPRGQAMSSPARLHLVTPAPVPSPGLPIISGIPMPPGALKNPKAVRLKDAQDRDIPFQARVTGRWPDGSIRWLLLEAIAPAGAAEGTEFHLHFNEGASPAPQVQVKVVRRDKKVTIDTGAVRLTLGDNPRSLLDAVYLPGQQHPLLTGLKPRMSVILDGFPVPVQATPQSTEIIGRGPVAACIEMRGSLDASERHIGRFLFRLYAYAGLPTVRTHFRIFNDVKPEPYKGTIDDPPLDVADLALVASLPGGAPALITAGVDKDNILESRSGNLIVFQKDAGRFTATSGSATLSDGKHSQGWITVSGANGSVQASLWRFREQHPKSLTADALGLKIGLFTPTETSPLYRPRFGEAKRHDIWLTFADKSEDVETQKALGLLADFPPRLFDGNWFCLSGGINLLDPDFYLKEERLAKYMSDSYGDFSSERVLGHFGIRNFGDMPYGSSGQWLNGYWAMVQGALNWRLASGDQRWLDRSFEIARHIADVDTVHIPPGHPDWEQWNGVTCALGYDHSVHGGNATWPAFQIGESLVLHYWMTGDPDSLEAAIANADYIIRSKAGLGSTEARSQARPMLTLLRVWQATGDRKYLQSATRYLDLRFQTEKVIDWRRGAYIQPTYENWRCISAGLDSMYAHNIHEYYRLTGDPDAAQLVVAIADSVYAESMLPQEEGIGSFIFYVRYSRNSWYYTQMALLFYMAYDLTGDERFLRAGRAAFERYRLCQDSSGKPMFQPFHNFGWLDPEFGGWQMEFKSIPTEPFNITGQTPVPDSAGYQ